MWNSRLNDSGRAAGLEDLLAAGVVEHPVEKAPLQNLDERPHTWFRAVSVQQRFRNRGFREHRSPAIGHGFLWQSPWQQFARHIAAGSRISQLSALRVTQTHVLSRQTYR